MKRNKTIPSEMCLDNTVKLLLEGYLFIPSRCRRYDSELFETRLMGQRVICMSGENAAQMFYNKRLFTRKGAIPKRIQKTLFGVKAIQTLDGAEHLHRKSLFMSFMTPDSIDNLVELVQFEWQFNSRRWAKRSRIVLFDEAALILCKAACRWAGVPLDRSEERLLAYDFSAMIDAFGAVGVRHLKGCLARKRTEDWMRYIIEEVRGGRIIAPDGSVLNRIAFFKDLNGKVLSANMAGIELINILRPITAIATYIVFGALSLHLYPEARRKIMLKENNYLHMFAQEIRRFYPFAPFLGARVRNDFIYNNYRFKKGTLVFLDIYGTNHDPHVWEKPYKFYPEHFKYRDGNPYDFIPQGGGSYDKGTRCPGEWITVEVLKASMDFLVNNLDYKVPLQNLSYSLRRMPTLPESGFVMTDITPLD